MKKVHYKRVGFYGCSHTIFSGKALMAGIKKKVTCKFCLSAIKYWEDKR